VEGSSHDFLTDAFRWAAGTDVATMRGFRYAPMSRPEADPHGGPLSLHADRGAHRQGRTGGSLQLKDQVENPPVRYSTPIPRTGAGLDVRLQRRDL